MKLQKVPISFCEDVANIADTFERSNTDLKKKYLKHNIDTINDIMRSVSGYCGSFGTGYPFYALSPNLQGNLPLVSEQIRYDRQLARTAQKSQHDMWNCGICLQQNGHTMPDLKTICKPCPMMEDDLKPRKVLNRLPDIDMWMVCRDDCVDEAKEQLVSLFSQKGMYPSDVNPIQTIEEVREIATVLSLGSCMPEKMLPLDIHIIEYSKLYQLINEAPYSILQSAQDSRHLPYLPIHPHSLRKHWQYDDTAYNFIFDFLYAFTPFYFEEHLQSSLEESRQMIARAFSAEQMQSVLSSISSISVKRRFRTKQLQKCYHERIQSWKK